MEKKLEFTTQAKDQIKKITKSTEKKYFRISVLGGGCSGFKYNFSIDNKVEKDDILFDLAVIDKISLDIINGSTIDFTNLPTSDPGVAGRLYNDSGTIKISL